MIQFKRLFIIVCLCAVAIAGCEKDQNAQNTSTPSENPTPTRTSEKHTELPLGEADKSDTDKSQKLPDQTPPTTDIAPTLKPVPVPAARPPKGITQDVPDVTPIDENGTAQNYQTPDLSGTIVPYLIAHQQDIGACKDIFQPDLAKTASNVYRVGENQYLVHLSCTVSAYQGVQEYYLYENTNEQPVITALPLTYFYSGSNGELVQSTERTMAGFSDYNPKNQTISLFTKGRGLGDCGSVGFYKFTGKELKLTRFLAKNECDGKYVDPINYPQVYP